MVQPPGILICSLFLHFYFCPLKSTPASNLGCKHITDAHCAIRYNLATFFALVGLVFEFFINTFVDENTRKMALSAKIPKYGTQSNLFYESTRPRTTLLLLNRSLQHVPRANR